MQAEREGRFNEIVENLLRSTRASRVTLRLDTPGKDFPVVAEACADGIASIAGEESISQRGAATAQRLMESGELLIQSDCTTADPSPPEELIALYGVKAQMLGPIAPTGNVVGWLSVHYAPSSRQWSEEDVATLRGAVGRVERALETP